MTAKPSKKEGDYRQGRSVPGYVLVIINHRFKNGKNLKKGNECDNIKKLFSEYNYKVRCFNNLKKKKILRKVARYSTKTNSGSLICFISSHGDQTSLACPNGDNVEIIDILQTAETKELESSPKIFFFDACRSKNGSLDGKGLPEPPTSNYYVGFSCLDTKKSWVGRNSCGVYFEEIVDTFEDGFPRPHKEGGKVRDLNHFMNKVHYAVSTNYGQVPTIRTTLIGKVFLQKPKKSEIVPPNIPTFH